MKQFSVFLLAFLAICFGLDAANPSYQAFLGTNGITITSNPPQGSIIIDGGGITGGSATNAIGNNNGQGTNTTLRGQIVITNGSFAFWSVQPPRTNGWTTAAGVAGNPNGDYAYKATFVGPYGETTGDDFILALGIVNQRITLSGIPTGPNTVTARRIYRTAGSGIAPYYLITNIADNTTTSITDNFADDTSALQLRDNNTLGVIIFANGTPLIRLSTNLVGGDNLFIGGSGAGTNFIFGSANFGIGPGSLRWLTNGNGNTALGRDTLRELRLGDGNSAFGHGALKFLGNGGSFNIAIGQDAGGEITNGNRIIAIGRDAFFSVGGTTNWDSVAVGDFAGENHKFGGGLVYIGSQSGGPAAMSNAVAIGWGARVTEPNQAVFGGTNIYGSLTNIFFGNGVSNASPLGVTVSGTGGHGNNVAGADIRLAAGKGTGSSKSGLVKLQTGPAAGAGSSQNPLVDSLVVSNDSIIHIKTNIALPSRTASSILRTDGNKLLSEVTIGANLTFDGTTLASTGGGAGVSTNANQFGAAGATLTLKAGMIVTNVSLWNFTNEGATTFYGGVTNNSWYEQNALSYFRAPATFVANVTNQGDMRLLGPSDIFYLDNQTRIDIGRNSVYGDGASAIRFGTNAYVAGLPEGTPDTSEDVRFRFPPHSMGWSSNDVIRRRDINPLTNLAHFKNLFLTNAPGDGSPILTMAQTNGRGYTAISIPDQYFSTNKIVISLGSNTVSSSQVLKVHSTTISGGLNTIVLTNDTDSTSAGASGLQTNANQFGAQVLLTVKDTPLFTNAVNFKTLLLTNAPGDGSGILTLSQTNGIGYAQITIPDDLRATNKIVISIGSNTVSATQVLKVHSTSISGGINTIVLTNDTDTGGSASPGGGDMAIQFNQGGSTFAGTNKFIFDRTNNRAIFKDVTGQDNGILVEQGGNITNAFTARGIESSSSGGDIKIAPQLDNISSALTGNYWDFTTNAFFPFLDAVGDVGTHGQRVRTNAMKYLYVTDELKFTSGAGSGKVLTSDSAGVGTWQTPSSSVSDPTVFGFDNLTGQIFVRGTTNSWYIDARTNTFLLLTNLSQDSTYSVTLQRTNTSTVTLSNSAAIKWMSGYTENWTTNFSTIKFRILNTNGFLITNGWMEAGQELALKPGVNSAWNTNGYDLSLISSITTGTNGSASGTNSGITNLQFMFIAGSVGSYSNDATGSATVRVPTGGAGGGSTQAVVQAAGALHITNSIDRTTALLGNATNMVVDLAGPGLQIAWPTNVYMVSFNNAPAASALAREVQLIIIATNGQITSAVFPTNDYNFQSPIQLSVPSTNVYYIQCNTNGIHIISGQELTTGTGPTVLQTNSYQVNATVLSTLSVSNASGQPGVLRIAGAGAAGRSYTELTVTNSALSTNRIWLSIGSNTVAAGHVLKVHATTIDSGGINHITLTNDTDNNSGGSGTTQAVVIAAGNLNLTNQILYEREFFSGSNGAAAFTTNWSMAGATFKAVTNLVLTNLTFNLTNITIGSSIIGTFYGNGSYSNTVSFGVVPAGTNIFWPNYMTNGNSDITVRPNRRYVVQFFCDRQTNIVAWVTTDDPYAGVASLYMPRLTADRVAYIDTANNLTNHVVTGSELQTLTGINTGTSIQSQLDGKITTNVNGTININNALLTNQLILLPAYFSGSNGAAAFTTNWDMSLASFKSVTNLVLTNITYNLTNITIGSSVIGTMYGNGTYSNTISFGVIPTGTNISWVNWATNGNYDIQTRPGYKYVVNFFADRQTNILGTVATDDPWIPVSSVYHAAVHSGISNLVATNIMVRAGSSGSNATVGGLMFFSTDVKTNLQATATFTNLSDYTLPANTLRANGDFVEFFMSGNFKAAAASTNEFKAIFGTATIFDTGFVTSSNCTWEATIDVTRTGSSAQRIGAKVNWIVNGAAGVQNNGALSTWATNMTFAQDSTVTNIFVFQGASRTVATITNDLFRVKYFPASK